MQLIRYTYAPDVREFGEKPVLVEDIEAKTLVDHLQRAVRVDAAELAELPRVQLVELAEEVGADVKKNASKAVIAKAVGESEKP